MKVNNKREIQLKTEELRLTKLNRADFKNIQRNEIYVILDKINNGYNLGAILRLCDITLVKKLFIIEGYNTIARKALTAAKGADKWVPYEVVTEPLELIKSLKSKNVLICSVEICKDSIDYKNFDFDNKPVCFIFGNEINGVSEELLNVSDFRIHLPTHGMCNSLNVSSCAAVILFEATKNKAP